MLKLSNLAFHSFIDVLNIGISIQFLGPFGDSLAVHNYRTQVGTIQLDIRDLVGLFSKCEGGLTPTVCFTELSF